MSVVPFTKLSRPLRRRLLLFLPVTIERKLPRLIEYGLGIGNGSWEHIPTTQRGRFSAIRCGEYPPKDGRASAVQNTTIVQYYDGSSPSKHPFTSWSVFKWAWNRKEQFDCMKNIYLRKSKLGRPWRTEQKVDLRMEPSNICCAFEAAKESNKNAVSKR